ncbi:MAG: YihY/virulence factor BrkB family protein [Bacteroidetes bacterium]|jgi:membrane protein|nr:YihY/virulence factor BrkB family protein [Bacteroidota bacterium]MBT6684804.1 YihY/virulence factor BrkB family protein [Bacteroidota bacterium]MBT7141780.1 YihY/virulence factor BrkB family protein [Bacteroidota bacterium]MBT7490748.1 YihY/virulence factor BrkB family protein [Bacteroidota bacterium]
MIDDKTYKLFNNSIHRIIRFIQRITLPGFDRVPIFDVGVFFVKGLVNGSLTTRASAVAFSFFLAIFPAIIFFFTLIPYIPINNFQQELLMLLESILPQNAYLAFKETLTDIVTKQRGGLLSFGVIAALIFSTNGISSMIDAFNASHHEIETRTWIAQRLISIVLVLILSLLITTAIILIVFSQTAMTYLVEQNILELNFTFYLLSIGKWLIIVALFFFAISFLYYFAPAKKRKWRFISAGSTLATILTIIVSFLFSFYINNFGQYNKLYGSIGTLLVILLWFYINAIILLTGFELNASIKNASIQKEDL